MGMKICPNCTEKLMTLTERCPKCGIIPGKSRSPITIGIAIIVILLLLVIIGLVLF